MYRYVQLPDKFAIFYDTLQEGEWAKAQVHELEGAPLVLIRDKGQNPEPIDKLIAYDRPDIIVSYGSRPILVLEKTEEVPTGHNVGQRFARIVRASELQVPMVYFFPFVAQKHGAETEERERDQKTNQRYVNPRLFDALEHLEDIHDTAVIPVNWPVDSRYELLRTPEKDDEVKKVMTEVVRWAISRRSLTELKKAPAIIKAKSDAAKQKELAIRRSSKYDHPPPTLRLERTSSLIQRLRIPPPASTNLLRREKSVVYRIGMEYIRADPYTGMLPFYDYLYARTGPTTRERSMNLVAHMPYIQFASWKSIEKSRKDIDLYTTFADCIILKDGVIG